MPKEFRFKTRKPKIPPAQMQKARAEKVDTEAQDGPPFTVQNQIATSIEYHVSQALDILGLGYEFQYFYGGGRARRGGSVIDFKVFTPGKVTLLNVNGRYWHTGSHNDELQAQMLKQQVSSWANFLEIWEEDCQTKDDALSWLRSNLYM